jgi:hypothetical protein
VEALQRGSGSVDNVAAGEDIGLADNVLAIITTTLIHTGLFHGRHCYGMPGCWFGELNAGSDLVDSV